MFGLFKKKHHQGPDKKLEEIIKEIHQNSRYLYSSNDLKNIGIYKNLRDKDPYEQKILIEYLVDHYTDLKIKNAASKGTYEYDSKIYRYYAPNIIEVLITGLIRRKLNYSEEEWIRLFQKFELLKDELGKFKDVYFSLSRMPINYAIKQIEYYSKENKISPKLIKYIKSVLEWNEFKKETTNHYGSDLNKAAAKLRKLIGDNEESFVLKSNEISNEVNEIVDSIKNNKPSFFKIFNLAFSVSGSKPTAKFMTRIDAEMNEIGLSQYKNIVHKLLTIPLNLKPITKTTQHEWQGGTYEHSETTFLSTKSQNFIKGLVWSCHRFSDKETISLLVKLAEKCYTKIPGRGPAAASVGNACVFILGNMKGKDGLGALSRLKLKVRQNIVKKSIDKFLTEGALKYNVSVEELKEMSVPYYGLEQGKKVIKFDDYLLKVCLIGKKLNQQWIKPDGNPIKSVPSKVKNSASLKKKLQDVRKEIKEIQKVYSAQKQRIDNQFILNRSWDYSSFAKYYLKHGLMYPLTSKLIWTFSNSSNSSSVIFKDGLWVNVNDEEINWIDESCTVQLWHPIFATEHEIVQWRAKIMELEWSQPIKQAYREIYILTEAEVNTKSYSNRMAAHILKQHQFSSLANLRNWKYALMGCYDDGRSNEVCSKLLPEYRLKAEYWIDELNLNDEAFNDAGIWHYVATDQVKFKNYDGQTIDLIDIPKVVFSEIMRDVDLFVGVCSVGNDPEWMDNNGERQAYRDYWNSYSFGDLNEIAKTRKEILKNLLPRLKKIRDKATIEGRFLIIKGQIRTYKIHIGSGNILMQPDDQYLCIVPARSAAVTNSLFIPFEGDKGLSIVLSKAFLLAEDDKITDSTITSQIKRRHI